MITITIYDDSPHDQQKNPRSNPARHGGAAGRRPSSRMSDARGNRGAGDRPTPIPIREALGEAAPASGGRSQAAAESTAVAPAIRDRQERPKAPNAARDSSQRSRSRKGGSGRSASRARANRLRESVKRGAPKPTSMESLPSRKFDFGGSEWIVRLSGRVSIGSRGDCGAQLLHLTFFQAVDPLVAARQSLAVGKCIEQLPEERLCELLASAKSAH